MIKNKHNICVDIANLFYDRGVRNICISPGLRNTAISLPFIKHKGFNCYSIIDERSSAYFAVGMSLKTTFPSVLICTSGTAVANYFPAIIESSQSRIPLIIITADRPKNLINSGTNQTINQKYIYGVYVRDNINIIDNNTSLNKIDTSLQLAIGKDYHNNIITPKGPIHINIHLKDFINSNITSSLYKPIKRDPIELSLQEHIFPKYKKALIVIGRLNYRLDKKIINDLSKHLQAPILADSLSQFRFNNKQSLGLYEFYINDKTINPDIIIRIGQKPVSKNLCKKLTDWKDKTILIDESGRFNDDCPRIIQSNYIDFIKYLLKSIEKNSNTKFYNYIINLDRKILQILQDEKRWSELIIANSCLNSLLKDENLFIGNSMPIRYIDIANSLSKININTYSNRGASGIDGVISTAMGVAKKSDKRTLLLIGDLSFYYDQNSLLIAQHYNVNLTIVIINNNGGGIFSLLPVSELFDKNIFKKYWTTPHNLDFQKLAEFYNIDYKSVESEKELNNTLLEYKKMKGLKIIDAKIDINKNKKIINDLKNKIKKG